MKILIKNIDTLETVTKGRFNNYDILIKDKIIKKVAKNICETVDRTIDASSLVALPGFINTHHHFYQTFTRNLSAAQNVSLFDWLKFHYKVWEKLNPEDIYLSGLTAMAEMMLTGVTTATDHLYLYKNNQFDNWIENEIQAAKEIGMRFYPGRGSMSLSQKDGGLPPDSVVQDEARIMAHCEDIVNKYHDRERLSMLRISLGPCSPFSVTPELLKVSAEYAKKEELLLHTHLAETKDEEKFCSGKFGHRPYDYMKDLGWDNDRVWYAHAVHLNNKEIADMAKNGIGISHCPSSNMRLGSGAAKIPEMLKKRINVSLGVDGSASNDTSDFLAEMRQMLLLGRVAWGAGAIKTMDVIKTATIGGANVLHWNDTIGSIEEGKAADITLWDLNDVSYIGAQSDPIAALIFSGRCHQARYVFVNGGITVEDGHLKNIDEQMLIKRGKTASSRLWKRAGII